MSEEFPFVSVVMPAFNEELEIGSTLDTVFAQDYTGKFEVIVCDNNSADRTAEIAESKGAKVVKETRKGTRFAYDAAMKAATGEIILVTNADVRLPSNWVSEIVKAYADPDVVGVGTRVTFYDAPRWVNAFLDVSNNKLNPHKAMWGTSLSCRRSVYEKVGGFNHGVNTNEDAVFTLLIEKFGKVKILDHVTVAMDGRRFNKGTIKAVREWFKGYGLNSAYMQINYLVSGEIKGLYSDFSDHRSATFGRGEDTQIAVVIPTGNHQKQIAHVLSTLQEQEFGKKFQIYVLDNFCVDLSLNIARTFPGVNVIKYPQIYSYSGKIAKLITEINAPVIAFTYPESDLPEDWLQQAYDFFDKSDNKNKVLSGPYLNMNADFVTKVTKQPLETITNKLNARNFAITKDLAQQVIPAQGDQSRFAEILKQELENADAEVEYDNQFKAFFDGPGPLTSSSNVLKATLKRFNAGAE